MRTLNPKAWWVQWGYLFDTGSDVPGHQYGPKSVSLCELFWRFVGVSIAVAAIGSIVGFLLYTVGHELWFHPRTVATIIGIAIGIVLVVTGVVTLASSTLSKDGVIRAAYHGVKENYCPIFRFAEPQTDLDTTEENSFDDDDWEIPND